MDDDQTIDEKATAALGTDPVPPVVTGEPEEIAPGVFVIHDRRVPLVPNIGIVVGDRAALVVDTAMGPVSGAFVREAACKVAGDRPLLLTVTHFHPEHGFGAQAFTGSTIVYNREQAEELRDKGSVYLEMFRGFGADVATQLEGVELVAPDVVYDGSASIDLGGRSVDLLTWGLAHTRGDQVVWLPDERIVFTGDLVENRFFSIFPYFPPEDADVDGGKWIDVLTHIEALGARTVVPGHGELAGPELVVTAKRYLAELRDATAGGIAAGLSGDELVAHVEPLVKAGREDWDAAEWIAFGVRCFEAAAGV